MWNERRYPDTSTRIREVTKSSQERKMKHTFKETNKQKPSYFSLVATGSPIVKNNLKFRI